jgi:hypothetical protein
MDVPTSGKSRMEGLRLEQPMAIGLVQSLLNVVQREERAMKQRLQKLVKNVRLPVWVTAGVILWTFVPTA